MHFNCKAYFLLVVVVFTLLSFCKSEKLKIGCRPKWACDNNPARPNNKMAAPRWYHGPISREDAESILKKAANTLPNGKVIYLVRKSNSSPKVCLVLCALW